MMQIDKNETNPASDEFLTESALIFLKDRKIVVSDGLPEIETMNLFGVKYKIITLKRKKSLKKILLIADSNDNYKIYFKDEFLEKKNKASLIKAYLIPYLLFDAFAIILNGVVNPGKFILIFLPIMYGYIIYAIAYSEAKDYLKKITDTITFFSASITASTALIKDLSLSQLLNSDKESLLFRIFLFILMQSFAIFATTKFCISLHETFIEREKYIKSLETHDDFNSFTSRTLRGIAKWCSIIKKTIINRSIQILSFLYIKKTVIIKKIIHMKNKIFQLFCKKE